MSTLLEAIKAQMFQAMKSQDVVTKEILKVAMGEITTEAARDGRKGDDEEARAILKKLVKSNEETLTRTTAADAQATLLREIEVLKSFLPKEATVEEVIAMLAPVADAIRAAKADGQATGVAMKFFKEKEIAVDGKIGAEAVKRLRA